MGRWRLIDKSFRCRDSSHCSFWITRKVFPPIHRARARDAASWGTQDICSDFPLSTFGKQNSRALPDRMESSDRTGITRIHELEHVPSENADQLFRNMLRGKRRIADAALAAPLAGGKAPVAGRAASPI